MSFLLMAAVVAAASAAGAALARRGGRRGGAPEDREPDAERDEARSGDDDAPRGTSPDASSQRAPSQKGSPRKGAPRGASPETPSPSTQATSASSSSSLPATARLPVDLGDVVSFDREERWLAGAILARDGGNVVGVLFLAPEGARVEAVAAFPAPRRELYWLSQVDLESGMEPPTSAEFAGVVMQRRARVPVSLARLGQGAPHVGEAGIWAEYEAAAGARAVLIRTARGTFAWSGAHCDEGEWDRMGRGG
jgi:hypothetical protein